MSLIDLQPAAASISSNATLENVPDLTDDLDDLFRPLQASIDDEAPQNTQRKASPKRSRVADELGIDEEVQVTKRRKPIAKLDDDRLLSQNGIPKLRRIVQEKLKFKGKGHEFSDISRMLNLYQLWLDDLYPRAKFADGLVIIEKLGHSKRMGVMRKEWIKESKIPAGDDRRREAVIDDDDDAAVESEAARKKIPDSSAESGSRTAMDGEESLFVGGGGANLDDDGDLLPDGDELDALLAEDSPSVLTTTANDSHQKTLQEPDKTGDPEESGNGFEDQYAEEMRMMADMENW